MKRASLFFIIITALGIGSCTSPIQKTELKTDIDTVSYYLGFSQSDGLFDYLVGDLQVDTNYMEAFYKGFTEGANKYGPADIAYLEGMRIAQEINKVWIDNINRDIFMGDPDATINRKAFLSGFYNGARNNDHIELINAQIFSEEKTEAIKEAYRNTRYAEVIEKNTKFLADNKIKGGVRTTPSGLQYKIITEGKGDIPNERSRVKVNYRGTLIDGTEFDSSYRNNMPSSFFVTQVIKGWTEALMMMPVGSRWELYIPQELGYGIGNQGMIPPFSTLIFDVELLEIEQ